MDMRRPHWVAVAALALLSAQAAYGQADTVTVKREAQLREAPSESARSLAALPVQTTLTRLAARQGPWIEVRDAQGVTGWVHMFDITAVNSTPGSSAGTGCAASR